MPYGFAIEILRDDGHPIEQVVIAPDWQPALDWTHFDGVRAGILPALTRTDPGSIEPIWDARVGEPYVGAFRVTVDRVTRAIPKRYVQRIAGAVSADVVHRHGIAPGTDLRWVVSAFPALARTGDADDDLFTVDPEPRPWAITDAPLARFLAAATPVGSTDDACLLPVFVPRAVLDEARALASVAGDVEAGGLLVGHLHRDSGGTHELFVEITAQLAATHTLAATTTITFTADTWAAAHTALVERGRDEVLLGWLHTHPNWCRLRACPEERWRTCTGAHPFFSAEDVHLHATCFPAGWQIGLLISDSAATGGLTSTLYGWAEGLVVPRTFHVLD